MVHPIRKGNRSLAESYRNILLHSDGFTTYEITHELAEYASGLRAEYNIRTPDAIQISAAILYGDGVLITNDNNLKRVKNIDILCIDDYI